MEYSSSLKERISSTLETLSPKHKTIARFVLDNDYFTSFASASQIGEKTNTTAATVVRFAQALGYEGFSELQGALRAEMPEHMTTAAKMQKRMTEPNPFSPTPQQVFYTDIKNIERTAGTLSIESINIALDAIQKAKRIMVIGAGLSYAPAALLAHSLKVMGFDAHAILGEGLQTAVEIANIEPDDLLVAIDLWRYVRMTVQAVSQVKEIGTPVIAITDSIVSPLAQMADIAFEVATEGVAHSLSITALISLLNVIVAMLADRIPEQVYKSLKKVDAAYIGNDLLMMK